jgi:sugar diacid utilization regulator
MGDALSASAGDVLRRGEISTLYGLFTVSTLMFAAHEQTAIIQLCARSCPSLGRLRAEAAYLRDGPGLLPVDLGAEAPAGLTAQVEAVAPQGGPVEIPGRGWARAVPLVSFSGVRGYVVVSCPTDPGPYTSSLLEVLVRQTAAALENATLFTDVQRYAAELRTADEKRTAVNQQLRATVADLARRSRVHEQLTQAATAPDVVATLATTVRDLAGLTTGIEDAFGNVDQSAAADQHGPGYRAMSSKLRDEVGQVALARAGRAVRVEGRLVALARPGHETLGAVVALDPRGTASDYESFVLEQAAVVLGSELSHRRSLVETELRLRRQLIDDLVTGSDDADNAVARAAAIGHDLGTPHCAAVVQWEGQPDDEVLARAVERVNTRLGLKALIGRRSGRVVLLVSGDVPGQELYDRLGADLPTGRGSIGVGATAGSVPELPRSFDEAQHALGIRLRSRTPYGVTRFDELGIYRILALGDQGGEIDGYVQQWLGDLIEYDTSRHSVLVETLAEFLDHGGNYDLTAEALIIHRSTLRYRLRRIRELTGFDLSDVESRLNLHVATRAWRILEGAR